MDPSHSKQSPSSQLPSKANRFSNRFSSSVSSIMPKMEEQLEELLCEPPVYLVEAWKELPGDLLVLGAGGKMGPSLCRMARRAALAAGTPRRIVAVSRFTDEAVARQLQASGIEVLSGDLLNRSFVASLPRLPLVVAMTGQKFGTTGGASRTWAMNTYQPAIACEHLIGSRIAAFSTGNVYGYVPVAAGRGSDEAAPLAPVGEYAMSAIGRERIYEFFSREYAIPMSIIRLNYAVELRYGLLVDIARRVWERQPVSIEMGYANVIWQADACAMALASLAHVSSPPFILNVTGPELLRCRNVALRFGELFGIPVTFEGNEAPSALLNNASLAFQLFGAPRFSVDQLIEGIARWIKNDGQLWNKPTHYDVRSGQF